MKTKLLATFFVAGMLVSAIPAQSEEKPKSRQPKFVAGEFMVKFKQGVEISIKKRNGIAFVGVATVDTLNRKYKVFSVEKAYPAVNPVPMTPEQEERWRKIGYYRVFIFRLPKNSDIRKISAKYAEDKNVEYAQPNYILKGN